MQETFVQLWLSRASIRETDKLDHLLIVIAHHKLLNALRQTVCAPSYTDFVDYANTVTTPSDGDRSVEYEEFLDLLRQDYNYANRYLVQFTLRHDGSSKFGSERRWGTFPSVALGWRLSEEPFFPKSTPFSNLKLRASWGRLGNENALGYYSFLALISTSNTMYQGYVRGTGNSAWAGSIARGLESREGMERRGPRVLPARGDDPRQAGA